MGEIDDPFHSLTTIDIIIIINSFNKNERCIEVKTCMQTRSGWC